MDVFGFVRPGEPSVFRTIDFVGDYSGAVGTRIRSARALSTIEPGKPATITYTLK